MRKTILKTATVCFLTLAVATPSFAKKEKKEPNTKDTVITSTLVNGLKFRNIGPAWASGRIADFAVNPDRPSEYYVGVASGNVWKTENNGITWKPIFDNYGAYSIGDVEMDPGNTSVIWVGTGENNHQRALGYGDGIYKSVDGGKSFKNMGLKNSRQIGGIVIDPRNGDVVFVACEGSAWGPGGERGLYKTTDGGKSWKKVLEISENTGVNNVKMDPSNPDILYATSEQRRRHHYGKIGGGPESAVYKSTDNGETWRKIMKGLPGVDIGGMGIDVSPVDPNVLYLIVEAAEKNSGFYRSTDKGESWHKMSSHASSGQYYNEIYCDPQDVDKVFSVETYTQYTTDAGKTWNRLGNKNRHVDDHALWINPDNTNHVLIGGDGGIYESYDLGSTWDFKENLPITQFYRVAVDDAKPFYNVYGGTQDNNSMGGPSRNFKRTGVSNSEWFATLGGDGFWQAIEPGNENIVYSEYQYGNIYRYDKATGEKLIVKPRERKNEKAYKWNWDSPMFISPHAPTRLYCAANKVFRSDDRGDSWEVISEDLTTQTDRNAFKYMDKYWGPDAVVKHVSSSQWGTIVSLNESEVQEGLIYAGTDDGVISITEDNGKTWYQVKEFPGVPKFTYVSDLQADKHNSNVVYAVFDNMKMDDLKPYVLKSSDKGRTWASIASNLPEDQPAHTIQQDHINKKLLFIGTEMGIYFSINAGESWVRLKAGIPTINVKDIAIQERENDLVLATFGRGFYILDDYSPLRDLSKEMTEKEAVIFPVKDALQYIQTAHFGNQGSTFFTAANPPYGAIFTYYIKEAPESDKATRKKAEKDLLKENKAVPHPTWRELQLEEKEESAHLIFTIRDKQGKVIRQITKKPAKGIQRIAWDLKQTSVNTTSASKFDPLKTTNGGYQCLPGEYTVELALWNKGEIKPMAEQVNFKVKRLNANTLPNGDPEDTDAFNQQVAKMIVAITGVEKLSAELTTKTATILQTLHANPEADMGIKDKARTVLHQLDEINFILHGVPARASWEEIPPAQMPISKRSSELAYTRSASLASPTETEKQLLKIIQSEYDDVQRQLKAIYENDIPELEQALDRLGAPWTPGRLPIWK